MKLALANQDGNNGNHHSGWPISLESPGVADHRSVAELHAIAPGKVDLTDAARIQTALHDTYDQIAVGSLQHRHADAVQGFFDRAGLKLEFPHAPEPAKVRRRARQDKRRGPIGRELD